MTTVANTFPTLLDVIKRKDPNGNIAKVVELLSKKMPLLQDIPFIEGNLTTGHRFTQRSALPSVTWRRLNEGLDPSKSATDQIDETCGLLQALSKVDAQLMELSGDPAAFRMSEDLAFVEEFNQTVSAAMFYSDVTATPAQFEGLGPRFGTTSNNPASGQIVKADSGASGSDQTSVWLVGWDPEKVAGIYPKGTTGGMQMEDLGKQLVPDANNKQFLAYVTQWTWKPGLAVMDYRYVARLCNIDTSAWKADLSAGADIALGMNDLMTAIYDLQQCRPVFYMNRSCYGMLAKQLVKRQANWLEMVQQPNGTRIPAYQGIPIKFTDSITSTEAVIS